MALDPSSANLTGADYEDIQRQIACDFESAEHDNDGPVQVGLRIGSIFVILVVSAAFTMFPVWVGNKSRTKTASTNNFSTAKSDKILLYIYLCARHTGAGVIFATAFIHTIGPGTCVGMTGGWAKFPWVPSITMASAVLVFLVDFGSELCVGHDGLVTQTFEDDTAMQGNSDSIALQTCLRRRRLGLHSARSNNQPHTRRRQQPFRREFASFLTLETSILFHSVIIGLTLGASASHEFRTLFAVIVFHQSFEGLGLGARMSGIKFPEHLEKLYLSYVLCAVYALATPLAAVGGIAVRTQYDDTSFEADVVTGVLNAISAGILLYSAFVEFLARDFIFDPDRTENRWQLAFMVFCVLFGAGIMAALGKWA